MSRRAQGWQLQAVRGKGLSPAAKLIMAHLCDRHTPDYGCFPGVDLLIDETEIPRATLMRQLTALEQAGLFVRVPRKTPAGRRASTRFVLALEDDYQAALEWASDDAARAADPYPTLGHGPNASPSPESGHGSMSQNGAEPCPISSGSGEPPHCSDELKPNSARAGAHPRARGIGADLVAKANACAEASGLLRMADEHRRAGRDELAANLEAQATPFAERAGLTVDQVREGLYQQSRSTA